MELAAEELLTQVMVRSLALRREDRYQKAREMVNDLELYMERHPRPLGGEVLGLWIKETATDSAPPAVNAVDLAVQRLLGQTGDAPPPAPVGTAVFAEAPPPDEPPPVAAVQPSSGRAPGKPLNVVLLVVAAVGVCGWLLWAYHHFSRQDRPAAVARVTPPDSGPSPAPPVAPRSRLDMAAATDGPLPARTVKPGRVRARARATGTITINSLPWSRVRLDGRILGDTPLVKLRVSAGRHRLELLSPTGKLRRSLRIQVPAGGRKTYSFDLEKAGTR